MDKIYCNCRMNVREKPGLNSKILSITNKGEILNLQYFAKNECDGYLWIKTEKGFIAYVDDVFVHANVSEEKVNQIKQLTYDFLDSSLTGTIKAVEDIKKALEKI